MKFLTPEDHKEFARGAERLRLDAPEAFTFDDVIAMREVFAQVGRDIPGETNPAYSPELTALLDRQLVIAARIEGMLMGYYLAVSEDA